MSEQEPRDSFGPKSQGGAWQPEARSNGKGWTQAAIHEMVSDLAKWRRDKREGRK